MQITNSVIQLAKERAQFGFAALAQQMLQDAEEAIGHLQANARSGGDQYTLVAARNFIQSSGKIFIKRVDNQYRMLLDRAMQTMYVDLRAALTDISASTLTLIDDDTVNQQIEIDRLVMRLRDADDEHLRRLNIVVGHLHHDPDAKERENPFRPYLMARTLHQSLTDLVQDEETRKRLFALLSDAMVGRLANFYASIRDVFETNGLHEALIAQKPRKQRDADGNTIMPNRTELDARVLPGLQRMLGMMSQLQGLRGGPGGGAAGAPGSVGSVGGGAGFSGGAGAGAGGAGPAPDGMPGFVPAAGNQWFPSIDAISVNAGMPGMGGAVGDGAVGGGAVGGAGGGGAYGAYDANQPLPQGFQEFVRGIFNLANAQIGAAGLALEPGDDQISIGADTAVSAPPATPTLQAGSEALVSRLNQYQQQAAQGLPIDQQLKPEQNQLFALGEQLGTEQVTKLERVAIDVVAMLFELILNDEKIPEALRGQIGRLQIPFLKAAMLTPDMLQQTRHPARQLINRLGSASVSLDIASSAGQQVEQEINRIVTHILTDFDSDVSIFTDSLFELERFLTDNLRHANAETEKNVQALEEVEKTVVQEKRRKRTKRASSVDTPDWLKEFPIDPRVVEFVVKTWMRVIEQEAITSEDTAGSHVYRELLPDLIWSVQDKQSQAERSALVGMLPTLANRLKDGLTLLQLSEKDSREALDQLVAVHTRVLRSSSDGGDQSLLNLEEMRAHFAKLSIGPEQGAPVEAESKEIETELAKRGVDIDLDLERAPTQSFESDADWLNRMQVGTGVERWSDTGYQPARLTWVSKRQTLYMFQLEGKTAPVVYSTISLIKSLREGSIRLVEYAPVFERAVESLLNGAREVENNRDV